LFKRSKPGPASCGRFKLVARCKTWAKPLIQSRTDRADFLFFIFYFPDRQRVGGGPQPSSSLGSARFFFDRPTRVVGT
jgi:hypothetical protein